LSVELRIYCTTAVHVGLTRKQYVEI